VKTSCDKMGDTTDLFLLGILKSHLGTSEDAT